MKHSNGTSYSTRLVRAYNQYKLMLKHGNGERTEVERTLAEILALKGQERERKFVEFLLTGGLKKNEPLPVHCAVGF
jgi:hypothetical protein